MKGRKQSEGEGRRGKEDVNTFLMLLGEQSWFSRLETGIQHGVQESDVGYDRCRRLTDGM